MAGQYQGHKNRNHWNVSLWLNNDPGLYYSMIRWIRNSANKDIAARCFHDELRYSHNLKTKDGAPYSISAIRAAMRGLDV